MELGHDPKDPKGIQALLKKKEEDIATLKKQLKLPITMHPQTTEVSQQKEEEDVMGLLMRMNERLAETEKALEEALQGKKGVSTSQPSETAPISTTAPPTTTAAVPPSVPASIAGTSASATTTIGPTEVPDTSLSMEDMMKEIKALELQMA